MRDIGGSVLVPMPVPGPMGVKVKSTHSHAPTQALNVPYFIQVDVDIERYMALFRCISRSSCTYVCW